MFASYAAVDNHIPELYLLAPVSNAQDVFKHMKRQKLKGIKTIIRPFIRFTADGYLLQISNLEKLENYSGQLVIFHGKKDSSLPYTMGVRLYKKSKSQQKKIYLIGEGEHDSPFEAKNWNRLIEIINNPTF